MRKKWIPGVSGALLTLTFATPALVLAQQTPTAPEQQTMPSFQQADQDGDGNITQSEAQSALGLDPQQFQRVDDNADSQLDPAEYEIAVNLAEQQRQMGQAPTEEKPAMAEAEAAPEGGELMQMRASEIAGKTVVDEQGEQLGEVDRLVRSNQDDRIYAVISMGGFLGIGGQQVVLPVEELRLQQDQLTVAMSKSQLQQQQKYSEREYQEVESEQQLAELQQQQPEEQQPMAGMESEPTGQPQEVRLSFNELDADGNGSISLAEIQQVFDRADEDGNGTLDQSEFSALETVEMQPGGQQQQMQDQQQQQDQMMQQPGMEEETTGQMEQPLETQRVAISFQDLDQDSDGYISRDEAQSLQDLTQSWQQWDNNGDDQLDRAEFSAFESEGVTGGQQEPGMQPQSPDQQQMQQQEQPQGETPLFER